MLFCAFRFDHSHPQDMENKKCVSQGPEGGHGHQSQHDVLVMQKGWTEPDAVN